MNRIQGRGQEPSDTETCARNKQPQLASSRSWHDGMRQISNHHQPSHHLLLLVKAFLSRMSVEWHFLHLSLLLGKVQEQVRQTLFFTLHFSAKALSDGEIGMDERRYALLNLDTEHGTKHS